ncbi:RNA polymerase sigma-70 factor [Olivibacter sp. XZL3]|uniref:RNA polymerase sigma-70 factor n=1 Tax=Olivibacter sp. XZL3 TaxID=1735116 RepID=UPI00106537C5|nr:RNA polymerase sigma-70 factor [Olivibacter sp. XZL3]
MEQPNDHLKHLWNQVCLFNDKKSFELLFYQLNRNLINFCNTFIHHEYAAEEIVSDVFVTCWNNRRELTAILNPKAYLYMAVKNRALNHLKKYSHLHLQTGLTDELVLIDTRDPNVELEKKEFFLKIDSIIQRLPGQTSLVFRLIKEDGMRYKEVAELLEISPRTVQTHMRRAIQKISECLRAYNKRDHLVTKNKLYSFISLVSFYFLHS